MTELLLILAGLVVGGVLGWLAATLRERSRQSGALTAEQQARVVAETRAEETRRALDEQRRMHESAEQRLKDAFAALASEALRANTAAFSQQAEEKLKPLHEALNRFNEEIRKVEKSRQEAYGSLTTRLADVGQTSELLRRETSNLVRALRNPQVRGRWGEITLQRAVELAGLSKHCDFDTQVTVGGDAGRQRPDLVVTLPAGRKIVVDAKAPLTAYLDAHDADRDDRRGELLRKHAGDVRAHMTSLAAKGYWSQFGEQTPEFVVLFLPGESFYAAAVDNDPSLVEDAAAKRVILASPATLIALLLAVAHGWQQQDLLENARAIGEAAKVLYDRVGKFAEHFGGVGDGLRRAVDAYNAAVASWSSRVFPWGRRLSELGLAGADPQSLELPPLDALPPSDREA